MNKMVIFLHSCSTGRSYESFIFLKDIVNPLPVVQREECLCKLIYATSYHSIFKKEFGFPSHSSYLRYQFSLPEKFKNGTHFEYANKGNIPSTSTTTTPPSVIPTPLTFHSSKLQQYLRFYKL